MAVVASLAIFLESAASLLEIEVSSLLVSLLEIEVSSFLERLASLVEI
jgi:hypothetical protein